MFKVMILWILVPSWEVRIVSTKTGKDIPGRCAYKGTYWRARKAFKKTKGKYGDMIRLQAVIRTDWKMNEKPDIPKEVWPAEDVEEFKEKLRAEVPRKISDMLIVDEAGEVSPEAWDIAASNKRQSEFMARHQDEPNFDGPEDDDIEPIHICNTLGPMEFDKALGYVSTCNICEMKQPAP